MENWTRVLSIIGALAWLPIIVMPLINRLRKVRANLFEFRVLSNGVAISAGERVEKRGAIILLVLNMFVRELDYYPTHISAKVRLKNDKEYNATLTDFSSAISVNDNGTISRFFIPAEFEFNISRTIRKNADNIKCMSVLLEGINDLQLTDIREIAICLKSGVFERKNVVIREAQFPFFNGTEFLAKYEEISQDTRSGTLQARTEALLKEFKYTDVSNDRLRNN